MAFCNSCGAEIKDEGAKFCPSCGAKIELAQAETPVENTQESATAQQTFAGQQSYQGEQPFAGQQGYQQYGNAQQQNQQFQNQQFQNQQAYNQGQQQQFYQTQKPATPGTAIASMVCGIASLAFCWLFAGVGGAVLGVIALVTCNMSKKNTNGVTCGMAKAGLVCGIIGICISALIIIVSIIAAIVYTSYVGSMYSIYNSLF